MDLDKEAPAQEKLPVSVSSTARAPDQKDKR